MNNIEERFTTLLNKFNSKRETHNNIANVWISFLTKYNNNLLMLIKQGEYVVDKMEISNVDDIDQDIINQLIVLFG